MYLKSERSFHSYFAEHVDYVCWLQWENNAKRSASSLLTQKEIAEHQLNLLT